MKEEDGVGSKLMMLVKHELSMLREELKGLKNCQMAFLTTSFTGTGLILGLLKSFSASSANSDLVYLLPLIIIVPCWWFFLDKARSVSRVVGYYRILEGMVLGRLSVRDFPGWEGALARFREQGRRQIQEVRTLRIQKESFRWRLRRFAELMMPGSPSAYICMAFYTFAALSLMCLTATLMSQAATTDVDRSGIPGGSAITISVLLVIFSLARNLRMIWRIHLGRYSYGFNFEVWKRLLQVAEEELPQNLDNSSEGES